MIMMQTRNYFRNAVRAVTACMTAVVLTLSFSACSDKDIDSPDGPGGGVPRELVGTWFGEYASKGEITHTSPGNREGYYVRAVQGLTFNADGTGTCYKYLCDVAGDAISIYGGNMDETNGRFHFTVKDDSIVTITRDGDGNAENPKTWTLINGSQGIRGADGATDFLMQTATDAQQGYLTKWEEELRNGGNDDESETSFLRNWENAKTVTLSQYEDRNVPWYGAANNDIPENIRFAMKKRDGWEMAFCMLNDPNAPDVHMFGLYNRLTGILRVYQYIADASGYGKELYFNVVNDSYSPYRYPFYNAMEYCIPVNKKWGEGKDLKPNFQLITNGTSYLPFEFLTSAYTRNGETTGVATNWHCFDLDLSAYMPANDPDITMAWRRSVDAQQSLFNIGLASQDVSDISMAGRLLGGLEGDYNSSTSVKSSCAHPTLAKITNVVSNFSGAINSTISSVNSLCGITKNGTNVFWDKTKVNAEINRENNEIDNEEEDDDPDHDLLEDAPRLAPKKSITVAGIVAVAAGLFNITSAALKSIPNPTTTTETTTGNISMMLNASINMSGQITKWVGMRDGGVTVTPFLLDATNQNSSIGKGCFGLADDPIIYIAKEDLLSSSDHINMTANGDKMTCPSIAKDSLRIIAFLDPASVKFMLNTDLYSNIEDLTVTLNYGVNLFQKVGHTDSYRKFMSIGDRPKFKLKEKMNDDTTLPRLLVMNPWETVKYDEYCKNMPDSVRVLEQRDSQGYRFFGRSAAFWGKNCLMDPQVFVPYTGSTVSMATVPDFFVSVDVTFKCDESPLGVEFCKSFLPKYVFLDHEQLLQKYEELKAYSEKCRKEEAVGALVNKPEIKVYDYSSHVYMRKTMNILKKIKEKEDE